jgi:hypothetical protein
VECAAMMLMKPGPPVPKRERSHDKRQSIEYITRRLGQRGNGGIDKSQGIETMGTLRRREEKLTAVQST